MDKIKYFFECLIPITVCNMKCHYCYVAQRHNRTMEMPKLPYSPEYISNSLSIKRLGGVAYISICGAGETTMVKELPQLCYYLTQEGHYVNITTNGTYQRFFDQLFELCNDKQLSHINFSFSLHYLELKRLNAFDRFFNIVNSVKQHGCSFMVQFNLCDEYEPYLEDIKEKCLKNIGALPQIAATRDEKNLSNDIKLYTFHTREEYERSVKDFNSPLFAFTMKNFNIKRSEYCYAGKWGGVLNLSTGILRPCYSSPIHQNIYKNLSKPIKWISVGKHCNSPFCMNSSHFISIGMIPEYECFSYGELRNRKTLNGGEWYNNAMRNILYQKIYNNRELDTSIDKFHSEIYYYVFKWKSDFIKMKIHIKNIAKFILKIKRK